MLIEIFRFLLPRCSYHPDKIAKWRADWNRLDLCDLCHQQTVLDTYEYDYADAIRNLEESEGIDK